MLAEHEIPEMPEFPDEDQTTEEVTSTEETPTPQTEESTEAVEETTTQEESSPSPSEETEEAEQPMEEATEESTDTEPENSSDPVAETPEDASTESDQEEVKDAAEDAASEGIASKELVEAAVADKDGDAIEEAKAEEETQKEEAPAAPAPVPEVAPEGLTEGLWDKMKEILSGEKSNQQILSEANLADLLLMLDHFTNDPNILKHIPRVGLVKRTFDALKYNEEFSEEQTSEFQEKLSAFNKNRVEAQKVVEDQKKENAKIKQELLTKLQEIVGEQDPMKIKEVREIQDKWREIGQVPRDQMDTLYKTYRSTLDDFYKRRELHFEMLNYDRKKNLQDKEALIAKAKTLLPPEEQREDKEIWKERMDILTELQQQWKSVGHVPREDMERINNDYRAVIDQFFEVRSIFLGKLDEEREGNAQAKEEILEKMAKFSEFSAERPKEWNDATRELKEFQDAWKAVGQAPYAQNNDLWNRYRAICDAFFSKKAEFFKKFDEFRAENLQKKRALCERAEEIAASGNWEKAAKELKQLQKDWKTIGPVPERHSNKLWNRFRAACDTFFEGRRAHYQKMHEGEYANLDAKKVLIEEVKKLTEEQDQNIEQAIERVKTIQKEWKAIGKVPFKEKDKIWEVFRSQVDDFFNGLSGKRSRMRDNFSNTKLEEMDDEGQRNSAIKDRVRRIRRRIGQAQEKVDQYSTNIEFIAKGKSGDALRARIQAQIDEEVKEIDKLKAQIKELNELAKKPIEKKVEEVPVAAEEGAANEAEAEAPAEEDNATEAVAAAAAVVAEEVAEEAEEASQDSAPEETAEEQSPEESSEPSDAPAEEGGAEEAPAEE
ncbi:MAG: DUF349 domain-containing protein [Bacteroidota bacterium]